MATPISSSAYIDSSSISLSDIVFIRACKTKSKIDKSHITNEVDNIRSCESNSSVDSSNFFLTPSIIKATDSTVHLDNSSISLNPNIIRSGTSSNYFDVSTINSTFDIIKSGNAQSYVDNSKISNEVTVIKYGNSTEYLDKSKIYMELTRLWITEPPEHELSVVSHGKDLPLINNTFDAESLYAINVQLRDERLSMKGTKVYFYARTSPYGEDLISKSSTDHSITVKGVKNIGTTAVKEMNCQVALYPEDLEKLPKRKKVPLYFTLKVDNGLQEVYVLSKGTFH